MKRLIGFSGGIDSQACSRWVLNRYPAEDVILLNSNAGGNEHPLTDEFVAWYSENVHPIVKANAIIADFWETPGFAEKRGFDGSSPLDFGLMMRLKGRGPSRKAQFCTQLLKLRPQRRWIREQFGPTGQYAGEEYVYYCGVRRDESGERRNAPMEQWSDWYDCQLLYPIADWSKSMCFDYVAAHGERVNPLYALGFSRVGCAPCVNAGKQDIQNWAVRFPEMIDKVRQWEQSAETERGLTFFPPMVPGQKSNDIDAVVGWSKTTRGGHNPLFPIMYEREGCESKYGLCG